MLDVLIAGAGPAGSLAAIVLARAGARVLLVDRETFPRDKLCGDTLSPGALRVLRSLDLSGGPLLKARPLDGMLLTGPRASVRALYGGGVTGLAITRRDLDAWLVEEAVRAGARLETGFTARHPLLDQRAGRQAVRGLVITRGSNESSRIPASLVIAADGRRSHVARELGLITHPHKPRRWAFGVYATGITGIGTTGEMHVRRGYYLGIAPIDDAISNVCVVTGPRPEGPSPLDVIRRVIDRDASIATRFRQAEFVGPVRVLGPLAVDAQAAGTSGLLLAGDAAGFVDPMTGDGLSLAMQGAVLAARETLRTLETGDYAGGIERLRRGRRALLGGKMRFNRIARALVDSPLAVSLAEYSARLAPVLLRRAIRFAGEAA